MMRKLTAASIFVSGIVVGHALVLILPPKLLLTKTVKRQLIEEATKLVMNDLLDEQKEFIANHLAGKDSKWLSTPSTEK